LDVVESTLSLFDVAWTLTEARLVALEVREADVAPFSPASGSFLRAAQMVVDVTPSGLRATTAHGAAMDGQFHEHGEIWSMTVPRSLIAEDRRPEIEDLVSLVVTTGWRRAGWVPLHAAGLTREGVTAIVCAGSRGGKTSFAMAMVRRGWRLVGDDKMLLGSPAGTQVVAAIKHMMNVDPAAARWFPELGDLSVLPEYSAWSPKRRVSLSSVWPEAAAFAARPTHVIQLARRYGTGAVTVTPLTGAERISVLLHQVVIPLDPQVARPITATLATLAQELHGVRVEIPDDAYDIQSQLAVVEEALL
jgi:hypothetical protein